MSQEVAVADRPPIRPRRLTQPRRRRPPDGAVYVGPGSSWDIHRFVHWCRPVWLSDEFEIDDPRWPAAGLRIHMDMRAETARAAREQLAGRDLVYRCEPQDPNCHAEVLLAVANSHVEPWRTPMPTTHP